MSPCWGERDQIHESTLRAPETLAEYHRAVLEAMESQRAFFVDWRDQRLQPKAQPWRSHKNVQVASRALQQAYFVLMKLYPEASRQNKNAFFDYHCALDFL